ncbi:MAG: hypothetical protein AAF602_31340 [Myxococcota bacterium]
MWILSVVGALGAPGPCTTPWHAALPAALREALATEAIDRRERALSWLRESPEAVERWVALAQASPHAEERRWARTQALDRDPAHPLARIGEARARWLSGDEAAARRTLRQIDEASGYGTEVGLLLGFGSPPA